MRVLGLDFGSRRVGVALSDPTGTFAQPLETIAHRGPRDVALFRRIAVCVEEHEVGRIVIGLPLHMDGRKGPEAVAVESFGARIAEQTKLPVEYLDERWTTVEAQRAFTEMGVRGRRAREHVDAVAATLILRTYLDRRPGGDP